MVITVKSNPGIDASIANFQYFIYKLPTSREIYLLNDLKGSVHINPVSLLWNIGEQHRPISEPQNVAFT